MRTRFAGLMALTLGLALGLSASAQTRDKDTKTNDSDRNANKTQKTVHGVIAGVTVEGELAIDYKAKKAVEADMTFLTIIGSPREERREANASASNSSNANRPNERDGNRRANRHRHNVYVVWLTPKTQFRDAERGRDRDDKNQADPTALTLADLEVGDRVEVTFNVREETNTGAQNQSDEIRRKHGRHRTYFGDATSITLVAEPAADRDRGRDRDRDRNDQPKAKDNDNNKDKNKD